MVKERNKIGILFSYSEGWIGGSYYFINLIYSFLSLKDDERPHVIIVSDDRSSFERMRETGYPYLSHLNATHPYSLSERILNKCSRCILNRNVIKKGYAASELPVLFGYFEQLLLVNCARKIYWIPDLQDRHFPQYLGEQVAKNRESTTKKIAYSNSEIIFSSQDSKNDFEHFYPNSICKKNVVHFAVTLPDFSHLDVEVVKDKYGIKTSYYISPNQFWSHKNHLNVIKAVHFLKNRGKEITVLFTGNEKTGGGKYASELKQYVKDNGLEKNCLFLGFIDRQEQLVLMKNSVAIIQPSLFEGWSTVVEDAKCLGKYIVLSDLAVHREQISSNVSFFSPEEEESLAKHLDGNISSSVEVGYASNVLKFAASFVSLI